jgi:hypothetical protein
VHVHAGCLAQAVPDTWHNKCPSLWYESTPTYRLSFPSVTRGKVQNRAPAEEVPALREAYAAATWEVLEADAAGPCALGEALMLAR